MEWWLAWTNFTTNSAVNGTEGKSKSAAHNAPVNEKIGGGSLLPDNIGHSYPAARYVNFELFHLNRDLLDLDVFDRAAHFTRPLACLYR